MKTVYKYPVPRRAPKFEIMMPELLKIIRVGFQNEELQMWAEVLKDSRQSAVRFAAFGTGQDIPNDAVHVATYDDGPFVLHLYRL